MELNIISASGGDASKIEVSEDLFAREFNESLIHQVVTSYLAGARQGTRAHKNRSAVSGGGAKPWRQKGTGRARAGTIRSPLWRTGGKTFAAVPQDHSQKVNKKMYRSAMRSIFSELVRQERLVVVDKIELEAPKTKELATKLKSMGLGSVLLVTTSIDDNLYLASRNLHKVSVTSAGAVDPVGLIAHEKVVITADALKKVEEVLA